MPNQTKLEIIKGAAKRRGAFCSTKLCDTQHGRLLPSFQFKRESSLVEYQIDVTREM